LHSLNFDESILTIQPGGPRSGGASSKHFNIEGKDNEKYASFGVLVFEIPRDVKGSQVKGMTLTLIQTATSQARYSPP